MKLPHIDALIALRQGMHYELHDIESMYLQHIERLGKFDKFLSSIGVTGFHEANKKAVEKALALPKKPAKTAKKPIKKHARAKATKAEAAPASSEKKPLVAERIARVMGNGVMTSEEIVQAMADAGDPLSSTNPKQYVHVVLSSNMASDKPLFVRASPGHYRTASNALAASKEK